MKPILIDGKNMSESTEVYENRPHPFFAVFIYLILGIFLVLLFWSYFSEIDIVMKVSGIVKTSESLVTIASEYEGRIKEVFVVDGQAIKQGDVLYQIDVSDKETELSMNQENLDVMNSKIDLLNAYKNALEGDGVPFSHMTQNPFYEEYKARLELIELNYNSSQINADRKRQQYNQSIYSYGNSIHYNNETISQLSKMSVAMQEKVNDFSPDERYYYNEVETYLSNVYIIQSTYNKEIQTAIEMEKGELAIEELEEKRKNELQKMEREQIAAIEQKIESISASNVSLKNSKSEAQALMNSVDNAVIHNDKEMIKITEIHTIYEELNTYSAQKVELENHKRLLEERIEKATVKSETTGIVNFLNEPVVGDYLALGTKVLTLIPDGESEYVVEAYIDNKKRGSLSKGMKTKCEIASFPANEYGFVSGVLLDISKDIKASKENGNSYYFAKTSLDTVNVLNNKGTKGTIKIGMGCEVRIVTDRKRVLTFILEKMNFLNEL